MSETHRRHPTPAFVVGCLFACRSPPVPADAAAPPVSASAVPVEDAAPPVPAAPPAGLRCLVEHLDARLDGDALVVGRDRFVWDDGTRKTTAERIAAPDLEDMFALGYPTGPITPVLDESQDPGRIRHEGLFRAVYGEDAASVSRALVKVPFAGHTVLFHRRGAAALARVSAKLELLLPTPALERLGGTFATRAIAGTDRTSAHAWGIAIDIDPRVSDYWRNMPGKPVWKNRVPPAIVEAFESEGFVWGGRWFHYDTMHFEYRPELLDARCRTAPQDR